MLVQTILNRVERHKSFVYGTARWIRTEGEVALEVPIRARANGKAVCSGCHARSSTYDHLKPRRFEFIPLWGIAVFFLYTMRRVDCARCGIRVEAVPWAQGKSRLTTTYQWFLASWAKRLSWHEVAQAFRTTWENVFRSVRMAVTWGLKHRSLEGIEGIGVDEILWRRGHRYLTLVYQLDAGMRRLLWVGEDRTEETFQRFFNMMGEARLARVRYVCSDMWKAYREVIRQRLSEALHILDRFHIMARINKAIDEVRAKEARRLKQDGYEPVLKHSRWCLLKRKENLTERQTVTLRELLQYNLATVRAYLLREDFQRFWEYKSVYWARRFLRDWCRRTMRSRIEPMKKMARSLREHQELLLNWFKLRGEASTAIVEGYNNKAKLAMRKAYGFRTYDAIETALFHQLGRLPEPESTHRFC